jgi:hypothetical protein
VVSRNGLAIVGITAAAVVVAIVAVTLAGPRGAATPSPSASPSASASPIASASATAPTASAATTATPSSTSGRYASLLGYSLELPTPWHKGSCQALTQQSADPGGEEFVPVQACDELYTDIGATFSTLRVFAEQNPQNVTPRQWAEQGKTIGGSAGERVEDVTYAGRPAARKTIPGTSLASYFVADRGRMIVVNPNLRLPIDAALEQTLGRIVASFTFLSDAERAAARAALPTAGPPRTPEQVADGIAAAFAAKDVDALRPFAAPCLSTAGEQAGASTVPRDKYLEDLRVAFAGGLTVTVRARPIDGDRTTGNATIGSTWQDSRGTKERKLMLRREDNDRWTWWGTLERFT